MPEKNSIIVPWDFTPVAEYALEHAAVMAKLSSDEVIILHIIDEKGKFTESDVKEVEDKLKIVAEDGTKKYGVPIKPIAREGNIFHTINNVSEEIEASLVIMGTHGMKGMQKLTGSWALKVIEGSVAPFLVIQDKPNSDKFEKILLPLDFKSENVDKIKWVGYLANYYKCKIHILNKKYSDTQLVRRLQKNLEPMKKFFESNDIAYEISTAEGKGKFHDQVVSHAKEVNADIIIITTTRDINTVDYVLGAPEQNIIANKEKISVMCINPRRLSNTSYGMGGF